MELYAIVVKNGNTYILKNNYNDIKKIPSIIDGFHIPKTKDDLKKLIEDDIPGSKICTSLIEDMSYMFLGSRYNHPLESWDVSNVMDMSYMFSYSRYNHPLGSWDVSNVKNMDSMFLGSKYNHPLESWNVSKVKNMDFMFIHSRYNHPLES